MPGEPTTTVRSDHSMWQCNHNTGLGQRCGEINEMTDDYCTNCGSKRGLNDSAMSDDSSTIGTLVRVDKEGRQYWAYDDPAPHK
ncbi:hypothetical protein NW762_005653 [Fusarium torreyae]|uniref:Uncharacterized protein n=1 Tax=Fusarium torreyae TaxID=1237075 RepID=A0A9W8VF32_9HYPO|nr:hypothetical protein NW762_005653 [Fusarium torreyae]